MIFSIFSISYWHIYKEEMCVITWDIISMAIFSFSKQTKKNTNGVWKQINQLMSKEDQSIYQYKHQKSVWKCTTLLCLCWRPTQNWKSPAHKTAELKLELKHVILLLRQLGHLLPDSLHKCRGGEAAQGHAVHVLDHLGQALLGCCARGSW